MLVAAPPCVLLACVSSDFADGVYACEPIANPACPPGLVCAGDGRCRVSASAGAEGGEDRLATSDASADAPVELPSKNLVGNARDGGLVDETFANDSPVAFPFDALESGTVGRLSVHIDPSNVASRAAV